MYKDKNKAKKHAKEYAKKWRFENNEHYTEYCRKYHKIRQNDSKYRERRSWYSRKYNHGITKEQFIDMLIKQKSTCPICNVAFNGYSEACIDHDHNTGKIRGLVHRNCNTALGFIEKLEYNLSNIVNYLHIEE